MRRARGAMLAGAAGAAVVVLVLAGASAAPSKRVAPAAGPIADSAMALSRRSVFATPVPIRVKPEGSAPGDRPKRTRAFRGAPPVVPHDISDFVPITRAENQCLECHLQANALDSGAVPMPISHYTDLRNAPEKRRETPAGARYVCTSCHAPGSDAPPLVGNSFPR